MLAAVQVRRAPTRGTARGAGSVTPPSGASLERGDYNNLLMMAIGVLVIVVLVLCLMLRLVLR